MSIYQVCVSWDRAKGQERGAAIRGTKSPSSTTLVIWIGYPGHRWERGAMVQEMLPGRICRFPPPEPGGGSQRGLVRGRQWYFPKHLEHFSFPAQWGYKNSPEDILYGLPFSEAISATSTNQATLSFRVHFVWKNSLLVISLGFNVGAYFLKNH